MNRYLELCIDHLLSFCGMVCVLDDGSTDGTFEYLSSRDRVNVKRNNGPSFYEHEGSARQQLYDFTLAVNPTYVLAIDADEFVGDPMCITRACDQGVPVYTLQMTEVWHATPENLSIRIDGLWKARTVPILYRPMPGWRIKDRQLACGREPEEVVQQYHASKPSGSTVLHFGWTRKSERVARAERYDVHDGGKFHQDRHLNSILWEEQKDGRLRLMNSMWPVGLQPFAERIAAVVNRP
jgi:glycosyltransferase involved in cell wall biosynthesis